MLLLSFDHEWCIFKSSTLLDLHVGNFFLVRCGNILFNESPSQFQVLNFVKCNSHLVAGWQSRLVIQIESMAKCTIPVINIHHFHIECCIFSVRCFDNFLRIYKHYYDVVHWNSFAYGDTCMNGNMREHFGSSHMSASIEIISWSISCISENYKYILTVPKSECKCSSCPYFHRASIIDCMQ